MLDHTEYTIEVNHHQGFSQKGVQPESNGNGYDRLDGDWALYYKVAKGFTHRVKPDYRQDFLHDLLLVMSKVKAKYEVIGKPLTEAGLIRVACYEVAKYWRKQYRITNGLDCGSCSQIQRGKCREWDLYRECPKAIKIESLNKLIEDGGGNQIELYQMIADDKAIDIVAMLDARRILKGYPRKLVQIAYKRYSGYPLDSYEQRYLNRHSKRLQKTLV